MKRNTREINNKIDFGGSGRENRKIGRKSGSKSGGESGGGRGGEGRKEKKGR